MSEAEMTGAWQPRSAWAGIARVGRHGRPQGDAGVSVTVRNGVGLATVISVEGQEEALRRILADRFGWSLPETGKAILKGEEGLVWSAPRQWLAVADTRQDLIDLPATLRGVAAVTDQSDGRAIVRVSGTRAGMMLSKGLAIDLHPNVFREGQAAVSSIAHIGIQIWQRDATPTYDISVARSFAGSFWSWLDHAAAEFGYVVSNSSGS